MDKNQLWAREMQRYVDNVVGKQARESGEWHPNITIGMGRVEKQRIQRRVDRIARYGRGISIRAHTKKA